MINRQAGTSVLAALVFVAIFVLFISGYKIASQPTGGQSAAVASTIVKALPSSCVGGDVHTVDMSSGAGDVRTTACSHKSDAPECAHTDTTSCVIRYCPPGSYVREQGTCFDLKSCDPAHDGDVCLQTTIQNARQSVQAANILAARLIDDKGLTTASTPNSGSQKLSEVLSDSGRSAAANIIEATADAAEENSFDADPIRDIAAVIQSVHPTRTASGPVAQISCQPKIAQSGMKIAVAFGCTNSVTSSSDEFPTGGRLWGATEVHLDPNLPNGTMTYGLRCSDGAHTAVASCSVSVMKPFMLFTSQTTDLGASLAWVTRGMDVCELNATGNPSLTSLFGNPVPQSGALSVPSVSTDTEVTLTCTSVSGEVKESKTTLRGVRVPLN